MKPELKRAAELAAEYIETFDLSRRGPSPVHRSSFGPVRHAPEGRAGPEGV